jgi:hypothetical protein
MNWKNRTKGLKIRWLYYEMRKHHGRTNSSQCLKATSRCENGVTVRAEERRDAHK